jgi:hypothetical protein
MTRRTVTIVIALFDAAACGIIAWASVTSTSDPATIGFDQASGVIAALLFAVTGAPALALTWLGKAPKAALAFAFAFPALLAALFIATVIYFAA